MTNGPPSLRGAWTQAAAQQALTALWLAVIPALAVALVFRYLVPRVGVGVPGAVAVLGHRHGLYTGLVLFFLFAGLARYWRYWLPGGRYATALPAHLVAGERDGERLRAWEGHVALYERLRSPRMRRRLHRALDREKLTSLDLGIGQLLAAIEASDAPRALEARVTLEIAAAPALAAARRVEAVRWIGTIGAAAAVPLALRSWVVQPYEVVSASMVPTLEPEDRVAGNKLAYTAERAPSRGEAIVFRSSSVSLGPRRGAVPEFLVKRVIGVSGDRVSMHGAAPVINGWEVPGCDAGGFVYALADLSQVLIGRLRVEFLDASTYLTLQPVQQLPGQDEYLVKPGEVFVLGDNRGNSLDSRSYSDGRGGGVPVAGIQGRAQWFLVGTNRSGETDLGRLLSPFDTLHPRLRFDGLDLQLDAKISHCLQNRPAETSPPSAGGVASASRAQEN